MPSDTLCFFSFAVIFFLQHSLTLLARPVMEQKANPKKWLLALSRGTNILHWILISMLEMCVQVHGTAVSKDTSEGVNAADCWPHRIFRHWDGTLVSPRARVWAFSLAVIWKRLLREFLFLRSVSLLGFRVEGSWNWQLLTVNSRDVWENEGFSPNASAIIMQQQ